MKKILMLFVVTQSCLLTFAQWTQSGQTVGTTSNEIILNSGNNQVSTLWLNNKNGGPQSKGNYYIKAFDWWGATLHFEGTGDQGDERLNVTFDGKLSIGTTDFSTQFNISTPNALGVVAGNYVPITRVQGSMTSNIMMVNDFWVRESNGSDWFSASYMRGISVDASFLTPTTLKSWIKQYPYQERIELGSSAVTTMCVVNGKVGINCKNPDAALTVNGTIHTKEVKVDIAMPADYVFDPSYKLMPLAEVEKFVKEEKHLPEIPSAAEIKENGSNVGEMQNLLLQKVEELTLYTIELEKSRVELEESRNEEIQKREALEARLSKLETLLLNK